MRAQHYLPGTAIHHPQLSLFAIAVMTFTAMQCVSSASVPVVDGALIEPAAKIPSELSTAPAAANSYRESRVTNNNNDVTKQDSKIMRIIENRTPQFINNERGAKLHIASGAYPVYYSIARANGRFGKHIRAYDIIEFNNANKL